MNTKSIKFLSIAMLSTTLAACGGGGGDTPPPVAPTPPTITKQPDAATAVAGGQVTLSVNAQSDAAISYQWLLNKQAINNGTIASGSCSQATVSGATSAQLVFSNIPLTCDAAAFSVQATNQTGTTTSQEAIARVAGFTVQPASTAAFADGAAMFKAEGNLLDRVTLKWKLNNADLIDGKLTSGVCNGATIFNSATQNLTVENLPVTCDSAAFNLSASLNGSTVSTLPANIAVSAISAQPSITAVVAGGTARFNISTLGASALQYKWSLNGTELSNGPLTSGVCSGATVSGVSTASLEVSNAPLSCDTALLTVKLTNLANVMISSGSAALNVSGIQTQPSAFSTYSNGKATFSITSGGTPAISNHVWKLNGTSLVNGKQTSGICNGATVAGAETRSLVITDIPLTCNGAQLNVTTSNSVGSISSSIVGMTIVAADVRSGIYKGFAINGQLYNVKVDFDGNLYEIQAPGGEVISGTLAPNKDGRGNDETGTFAMSAPSAITIAGAFRYTDDILVGNLPTSNAALLSAPIPFIGARKFAQSASEITRAVDLKLLGLDIVTGTTNTLDSNIRTAQITNTGFVTCSNGALSDVSSCVANGSTLTNYTVAYQTDGSVILTNTTNATDVSTGYFAKVGSEFLYLRAESFSSGIKRFRIGLESLTTLSANVKGYSKDHRGTLIASPVGFSYSATNVIQAGPSTNLVATPRNNVIASGLFSFGDTVTGTYFSAQSAKLVVVIGARDTLFPLINGFIAFGTP
jgi:hypothetical protein